jgi:hypothetical protein
LKPAGPSAEDIERASVLGWCIEWVRVRSLCLAVWVLGRGVCD